MLYSRRTFLKHLSFGTGLLFAGSSLPLLAASETRGRYYLVSSENEAVHIDLQTMAMQRVDVSFQAHSYIASPDNPFFALGVEKWGPSAAFVDFKKSKIVHAFASPKGTEFYGHGIFFPEKNAFFVTRVDLKSGEGHLVGYDADTFKETYDFPVTPGGLHECHLLPDKTLLVTSSGIKPQGYGSGAQTGPRFEASGLVHVDMGTGQVLGKKLITDDDQVVGHFAIARDETIVALSGPRPGKKSFGEIYLGSVASPDLRRLEWTANYAKVGEMLSVSMDEAHHRAAVTNPTGNNLFFLDTRSGQDMGHIPRKAFGVGYHTGKGQFLFSGQEMFYANEKKIFRTLSSGIKDFPLLNGAHGLLI